MTMNAASERGGRGQADEDRRRVQTVGGAERAVDERDDGAGDGDGAGGVEPAAGAAGGLVEDAAGQDDGGDARPGRSPGTPRTSRRCR